MIVQHSITPEWYRNHCDKETLIQYLVDRDSQLFALRAEVEGLTRNKQIADALMLEGSQKIDELRQQLATAQNELCTAQDHMNTIEEQAKALVDKWHDMTANTELPRQDRSTLIATLAQALQAERRRMVRLIKQSPTISLARGDYDVKNQVVLVKWIKLDDLLAVLREGEVR